MWKWAEALIVAAALSTAPAWAGETPAKGDAAGTAGAKMAAAPAVPAAPAGAKEVLGRGALAEEIAAIKRELEE